MSALKSLTGKSTRKRSPKKAQPQIGGQYQMRMDLKEIGVNVMNWIGWAQNRDY